MLVDSNEDEKWMAHAITLANQAEAAGEVPVGAVIIYHGECIGEGFNRPISTCDPSAHAEIIALRQAALHLNNYRLLDCTLYATLEPCIMCAGAIVHARIKRVVFGATDPRVGAAGSAFNLLQAEQLNHRPEVTRGILAPACSFLLAKFFQAKRTGKNP